ncbi:hypothetical protein C5Y96_21825 [Blastopirellula marina]|uniref:Uncharacterized protein n=1 Tax=Blastopirellula marina TaxID=124 RepID=A0A2S8F1N8_9BACT|nr:hypothetical protein C5Y96_21825 [Blastopirellula marina]RCS44450.1 hypothetical protein DTL36_21870 [Bremerella cremea]
MVIAISLVLFAVFIVTQFDPIDRVTMACASIVCIGLAFLIIGAVTAVGNFEFTDDSPTQSFLLHLWGQAQPQRRFGEVFYSRDALYVVFEKILIAIVIPLGIILAFVRPKQTWPAILWVGGGILAILGVYLGSVIYQEINY